MNRSTLLPILCFVFFAACSKENDTPEIVTSDVLADQVKLTRVKQTYPSNGTYYQTDFRFERTNNETNLVATILNNQNGLRYYKEVFTHDLEGNTKEIKFNSSPNDTLNLNTIYRFFRTANGINKIEHYFNNILTTIYSFNYPTSQQINYIAYSVNKYDTSYVEMKLNNNHKTWAIAARNIYKYPNSATIIYSEYADTLDYDNYGISRQSYKATSKGINSFYDTTIYSIRYFRSGIIDSSVYKILQFIKGTDGQSLPDFQNASLTYSFIRYHSLWFLATILGTPSIQSYIFSVTPYEKHISSSYVKANGVLFLNPSDNIVIRDYYISFGADGRISKLTDAISTPGFLPVYSEYFY